jgi:hypothetical protein
MSSTISSRIQSNVLKSPFLSSESLLLRIHFFLPTLNGHLLARETLVYMTPLFSHSFRITSRFMKVLLNQGLLFPQLFRIASRFWNSLLSESLQITFRFRLKPHCHHPSLSDSLFCLHFSTWPSLFLSTHSHSSTTHIHLIHLRSSASPFRRAPPH